MAVAKKLSSPSRRHIKNRGDSMDEVRQMQQVCVNNENTNVNARKKKKTKLEFGERKHKRCSQAKEMQTQS